VSVVIAVDRYWGAEIAICHTIVAHE